MVIYKAGDVIMTSEAFVHVVKSSDKGMVCDFCLKETLSLRRCSQCKDMFYCSQACQRQDWNHVHKLKECKLLSTENGRRCNSMDRDLYRLLVRLVVKTLYDETSRNMSYQLFDGTSRCLEDLMDHVTELRCDKQRYHMLKLTAAHIIDLGVEETEDGIIRRANQIFVNAFGIQLETLERKMAAKPYEIALGFYIEGSYLDHSCKPNAAQVFVGKTMIIRALCDIDSDKQSVTDSYIDLMTPVGSRLQKLKQTYYFDCTCQRCVGDKSDSDCDTFQSLKQEYQLYNENDDYLAAYETVVHMIPIVERSLGRYSLWMSELCWMKLQFKLLDAKQKGDENVTNLHHLWLEFVNNVKITHGTAHEILNSKLFCDMKSMFDG